MSKIIDVALTEITKKEQQKKTFVSEMQEHFSIPRLVEQFLDDNPLYFDHNKIWWFWNKEDFIWEIIDETDLLVYLSEYAQITGLHKSKVQSEFLNSFKIQSRKRKPHNPKLSWLQFGSRVIDINSGKEFEATAEYFFTNSLPFTPTISDETPTMDKMFCEWVGKENVPLLYEIIAYCCYRDYPLHHLFCFVGAGANGKSTFMSIVSKFISKVNCCSVSLDKLCDNNFAAASLYKKLVCMMGETNFSTMKRTELLKKLTGQDLIDFEFKGKQSFTDNNYAKILISTNTLPETTDRTDGFYRRWIIVDFPNRFDCDFDILSTIPDIEYNALARRVINILPNLLSFRRFHNVGSLEDRRKRYEDRSNPLPKFLDLYTDQDVDGSIFKFDFRDRFNMYLKQNNLRALSDTEIGIKMSDLGFSDKRVADHNSEKVYRAWLNIRWKASVVVSNDSLD